MASETQHLLIILPIPRPDPLINRLQAKNPQLKITYLRHEVDPVEAFKKQDMDIPQDILQTVTILLTMSVLPEPIDAPKLRYIHFSVTGTNHVAHRTVFKHPGITITTSAGAPAPAVAEWVIGSILAHSRSLPRFQQLQKESAWGRLTLPVPGDLVGKKMAILGYGSIGRQVGRLGLALGMEILAFTGTPRLTAESRRDRNFHAPGTGDPDGAVPSAWFHGLSRPDLHEFLGQGVDVLVMTLPLTAQTHHLIGHGELAVLNKAHPVFLVNVARGEVLDQAALLEYLEKGPSDGGLSGAALDVADPEPLPSSSELWGAPNIFISPHVSSITSGTMNRVFQVLEGNLERLGKGERMLNIFKDA